MNDDVNVLVLVQRVSRHMLVIAVILSYKQNNLGQDMRYSKRKQSLVITMA